LARRGGKYVGAVLVELPEDRLALLRETVPAVDAAGLKVEIIAGEAPGAGDIGGPPHLSIVGQDRLGIVREVTRALAALGINIEAFESSTEDSPWSGGLLFKAEMALRPPAGMTRADVQAVLESVSGEIMVDFAVAEPAARQP
jgi:glycine cleavage system regulatory protein